MYKSRTVHAMCVVMTSVGLSGTSGDAGADGNDGATRTARTSGTTFTLSHSNIVRHALPIVFVGFTCDSVCPCI